VTESKEQASLPEPADLIGYEGFIEAVEDGRIYGWALDHEAPDKALVIDIYHGTELLVSMVADRHRDDVADYSGGQGNNGFVFNLPRALWGEDSGMFYACYKGTYVPLLRGPKVSRLNPLDHSSGHLSERKGIEERFDDEMVPAIDPLIKRIESCERAVVSLVQVAHPGSEYEKSKDAKFVGALSNLESVKADLSRLEALIVRIDEIQKRHNKDIIDIGVFAERPLRQRMEFWPLLVGSLCLVGFVVSILFWGFDPRTP